MDWTQKTVLITGGTGSFGRKCVEILLAEFEPRRVIVFSRDELKQQELRAGMPQGGPLTCVIGDVRDRARLRHALRGVDIVIHAAALKQVPVCEEHPSEGVLTNILGAQNVVEIAIECGTERAIAVSTDKAVAPVNLYGATKLVAEKLFVQGNAGSSPRAAEPPRTRFACARYGNVVGSRGSVVPLFCAQRATGRLTVTDARMTRFWIPIERAVRFVLGCLERMHGGEIFVPKVPSLAVLDLARAIAPECRIEFIGMRPGEKLHEVLLSEDEVRHAIELDDCFVIEPLHAWWNREHYAGVRKLPVEFEYGSGDAKYPLDRAELLAWIAEFDGGG